MPTSNYKHGLAYCPGCQTALAAPFAYAGRSVTCKSCDTRFDLPDQQELFEAAVAFLVEHDLTRDMDERDAIESVSKQIREETMVRFEPAAHQDPSWQG